MSPPPASPLPDLESIPLEYSEPPKWSVAAIVGFVLSFLLILAPLGVVFGIVGIFRTTDRRRRGRGLSIAAIPIGLVVSAVTGMLILFIYVFALTLQAAQEATAVLTTSRVSVPEKAGDFYDQCSRRFQLAVSREDFEHWLTDVIGKHGSLQGIERARQAFEADPSGAWTFNFTGQFVNGTAHVGVTLGRPDGYHPEVFDIVVDGISAIPDGTHP